MATQDQAVVEGPIPVGIRRSLSDRPLVVRWLIHFQRFMVQKPLGGFGVVLIVLLFVAAIFAAQLSRYDPEAIFKKENPAYNPLIAELAQSDPTFRLKSEISVEDLRAAWLADNPGKTEADLPSEIKPPNGDGQVFPIRPEVTQKGDVPLNTASPSSAHWLGTDGLGRDLYARIIYGSRTAVQVGVCAALIAVVAGVIIGLASAYFGGGVDFGIQRVVDTFQAYPPLVILLLFTQVVATPSLWVNTVSLGIIGIAQVVRIVRSAVLAAREDVYVQAARTIGASDLRIMFRHIFPNVTAPIIVIFTSSIGLYILAESTLAFLGLGDPVAISWGKMVEEGRRLGPSSPLMALFVGSALTLTVLGFNLAGDALRDALDPRLRGRGGRPGF